MEHYSLKRIFVMMALYFYYGNYVHTTELQVTGLDLKNKTGIPSSSVAATTQNKDATIFVNKVGGNTTSNKNTTTTKPSTNKDTIKSKEKSPVVPINNNMGQAIQKDLSAKSEIYKMHTNGLMLLHAQRSTQGNGAKKSELTASSSTASNSASNKDSAVGAAASEEESPVNYHVWKKSSSSSSSSVLPLPAPLSTKQITPKTKRNQSSLSVADKHFRKTATTRLGIITNLYSNNIAHNKTAGTKRDTKSLGTRDEQKSSSPKCTSCNLVMAADQRDGEVVHPTETTTNNFLHHQRKRNKRQLLQHSQYHPKKAADFFKMSIIPISKLVPMIVQKETEPRKTKKNQVIKPVITEKREVYELSEIQTQKKQPQRLNKRNSDNPLFDDDQPEQVFERYTKEKRRLMKLHSRYDQADTRGDVPPIAPIKAIPDIKSRFDNIEPLEHFPRFAPFGPDAYDNWPRFGVPDLELKHYPRFGAPKMDDFELLPGIPHIRPLSRGDEATGSKRDYPEKPDDDFYDQELDDDVEHNSPITSPTSIPFLTNIPDIQDIQDIPTIKPAAAAARRRSGNGEPAVDTIHTKDGDETRVST